MSDFISKIEQLESAIYMARQLHKFDPAFSHASVKGAIDAFAADAQAVVDAYWAKQESEDETA